MDEKYVRFSFNRLPRRLPEELSPPFFWIREGNLPLSTEMMLVSTSDLVTLRIQGKVSLRRPIPWS